jgi:hypothetical protein
VAYRHKPHYRLYGKGRQGRVKGGKAAPKRDRLAGSAPSGLIHLKTRSVSALPLVVPAMTPAFVTATAVTAMTPTFVTAAAVTAMAPAFVTATAVTAMTSTFVTTAVTAFMSAAMHGARRVSMAAAVTALVPMAKTAMRTMRPANMPAIIMPREVPSGTKSRSATVIPGPAGEALIDDGTVI